MKKSLLSLVCVIAFVSGIAQQSVQPPKGVAINYNEYIKSLEDVAQISLQKTKPIIYAHNDKFLGQEVLENTVYDLQTNASVQDRINKDDAGNISVVWTASQDAADGFSDRGTGYSFFDGTSWNLSGDYPRIESVRCGWPSILYPESGGEIIISHSTEGSNALKLNSRATRGSGSWTEKDVSARALTWQRSAMGGSDGNSIHMVAITDTNDAAEFLGMSRALVYYRSTDGGSTFDIQDSIIPGLDSASFDLISGDSYAIDAKGTTVAIAVFPAYANDVVIVKSTDNGDTWTKTVVFDHPFDNFDDFDNNYNDTTSVVGCDGSGAILIDDNDVVHVTFGRVKLTNDSIFGNGTVTRTYIVDSLIYWNENMGAKNYSYSGALLDADEDGNGNVNGEFANIGNYRGTNVIGMPSMALGDDGTIWTAYSAVTENYQDGSSPVTNLRHIMITKSDDGGNSWSKPVDLNANNELVECVYPSLYKKVDDKLRLVYMRDNIASVSLVTPGAASRWTYQPSVTQNEIVYYEIGTLLNVGVETVLNKPAEFSIYPNPANDRFTIATNLDKPAMVKVTVADMLGKQVYSNEQMQTPGQKTLNVDISNLKEGLYLVTIASEGNQVTKKLTVN